MKLHFVLVAAIALAACNRPSQNQEAVREGVIKHLTGRSGLDVSSMQVDVTSVTFRDNEADAVVSFRPRNSTDPSNSMQMRYTLERKGDEWVVKSKSETGGSPHGAAPPATGGQLPPGHPPPTPPEAGKTPEAPKQ